MVKVRALRSFYHNDLHERGTMVDLSAADAKKLAAKGVVEFHDDKPDEPREAAKADEPGEAVEPVDGIDDEAVNDKPVRRGRKPKT